MYYEREIYKLEQKIKELKAKQALPPVWAPEIEDVYYIVDVNGIAQYAWHYDEVDERYLKLGNLFKTEQEADNYARAMGLIEMIRRERFKAQGNWWAKTSDSKYIMCWDPHMKRVSLHEYWSFPSSVFGSWRDRDVLKSVVERYTPELRWYFTEYLPATN